MAKPGATSKFGSRRGPWDNAAMAKKGASGAAEGAARAPVVSNRKAFHRFEVLERHDCGIVLRGPEVKSLRLGRASLDEAYARFRAGELWLLKMHIDEYAARGHVKLDPARPRKLLLHRRELTALADAVDRQGLTLVPLRLHWNARGVAKVEIALARGKKLHDKRETERARSAKRDMDRMTRRR